MLLAESRLPLRILPSLSFSNKLIVSNPRLAAKSGFGPQLFSMQHCSSLSTLSRSTDPLWCGASRKQNAEQLRVRSPRERRPCLYTTFGVLLPLLGRSSIGFVCEMGGTWFDWTAKSTKDYGDPAIFLPLTLLTHTGRCMVG
jgi:hypothetical protein